MGIDTRRFSLKNNLRRLEINKCDWDSKVMKLKSITKPGIWKEKLKNTEIVELIMLCFFKKKLNSWE